MGLLFDLDGTLTDPGIGILASTRYALAELGKSCPSDAVLASFIGPPLRNMFRTILETSDSAVIEEAVRLYRERYTDVGIYESHVYDGVPAMLRRVRCRASKVFLATSKPTVFANRIVDHFNLAPYFDAIYGTELDGRFDDKADLLSHIVSLEDVRGALMVGDRAADILAARRNGLRSVGVLWGYGSAEELLSAGADKLCETPEELDDCLIDAARFRAREC